MTRPFAVLSAFDPPRTVGAPGELTVEIDVGHVIAGKYELVRLLGRGAMGEVWLTTHRSLGGEFAIKLMERTAEADADAESTGRFQLEAQIAAKLSRKTRHIVSVSDHGEEDGVAYLVMELLEGESLEKRIARGPLPLEDVALIVAQIARALSLAHDEGIFHRDLKPANVWLGEDEDGRLLVKLLDFGIARSLKPFRARTPFSTNKDAVLGTPSYMSPEQARGLEPLDSRCDLWALAVVTYEALTGQLPFDGETVEDIFLSICTFRRTPIQTWLPDLPPSYDGFFERAFAREIGARFQGANDLALTFEQLLVDSPEESAKPLSSSVPPDMQRSNPDLGGEGRERSRFAALPWAAGGLAVLAVGALVVRTMGAAQETVSNSAAVPATAAAVASVVADPPAPKKAPAATTEPSATPSSTLPPSKPLVSASPRHALPPPSSVSPPASVRRAAPPMAAPAPAEVPAPKPAPPVNKSELF